MTSEGLAALARRALSVQGTIRIPRLRAPARPLVPVTAHAVLPVLLGVVWALLISGVHPDRMTDLGLASVLPAGVIILLFVLTVSFCLALTRRPLSPLVPLIHVVVLVILLYGITTFVEAEPRVSAVYRHAGVIDYISHYGSVNTHIDAYFNWPGFFALGALITKAAGFSNALAFGAWGPVVFNLLFLAPLVVIFRWASDDPRVMWLGLWVYYSTNWVAQDHISPQAMGYLLWLSILAALLTWFVPRPAVLASKPSLSRVMKRVSIHRLIEAADIRRMWSMNAPSTRTRRQLAPAVARRPAPRYQRLGILALIVVAYAAVVTGHQLTPVPAVITVVALVLWARLETRWLPLIMVVLLAAWIGYMTTSYLAGNFNVLAGPLGQVSTNLNESVTGRVAGSSQHQLIVNLRLFGTAAIWLLAVVGFARRFRGGRADTAMALIAGAPFLLPLIQPYGGEILLRVFLFALPAVSFAIAGLVFPSERAGRQWLTIAGAATLGCILLTLFQYTRYGNERLDNFTRADAAVVHDFYRVAPLHTTVYAGAGNLPWRYAHYNSYNYRLVTDLSAWKDARPNPRRLAAELKSSLQSDGGGYVIVTRSTEIWAGLLLGKAGALESLVRVMQHSPAFHLVYRDADGYLFLVKAPRHGKTPGARAE